MCDFDFHQGELQLMKDAARWGPCGGGGGGGDSSGSGGGGGGGGLRWLALVAHARTLLAHDLPLHAAELRQALEAMGRLLTALAGRQQSGVGTSRRALASLLCICCAAPATGTTTSTA
jgi:hypothetical protein